MPDLNTKLTLTAAVEHTRTEVVAYAGVEWEVRGLRIRAERGQGVTVQVEVALVTADGEEIDRKRYDIPADDINAAAVADLKAFGRKALAYAKANNILGEGTVD